MKPSVTKLIDLLNKPALLKWANKIGLQGIPLDSYRDKVKSHGTDLHYLLCTYAKTGALPIDKKLSYKIVKFFSDKEIIDCEKDIETDYFVGRYDIKLKWEGSVFICDYKRSGKVYFENLIQLASYKMASECDYVAVIHTNDMAINPVYVTDEYYEFIITLAKLYDLKQTIDFNASR